MGEYEIGTLIAVCEIVAGLMGIWLVLGFYVVLTEPQPTDWERVN